MSTHTIIIGKKGNQKTPITDPTVSREHCKVTANGDGTYTVENLSQNGTKVDGVDIIRTIAKPNSRLQLGPRFSATLLELIGVPQPSSTTPAGQETRTKAETHGSVAPQSKPEPPKVKTYNISHLKRVWEDFNGTNIRLADEQRKINLIRTGCAIFTMCTVPVSALLGGIAYILTGIGVLGNLYSFIGLKNAETAEERQKRQDAFDDAWVCPNPECGHSLLARNYKYLVRNHESCPYCKCKYVER